MLLLSSLPAGLCWHLIMYADGITPGNVLAPENRRKSIVWYVSFLEFGAKLAYEEAWMTVAVARTAPDMQYSCVIISR